MKTVLVEVAKMVAVALVVNVVMNTPMGAEGLSLNQKITSKLG